MQKKLTITVEESVYKGLHQHIGKRKISKFIENLVKPHVVNQDLEAGYKALAEDEAASKEAHEWIEAVVGDLNDETL